jgi:hypothetical protein
MREGILEGMKMREILEGMRMREILEERMVSQRETQGRTTMPERGLTLECDNAKCAQ